MNAIDLMAGTMQAMRARLDVATAGLANVSSDGFRRSLSHARFVRGAVVVSQTIDDRPGALHRTGRSLDLATVGAGSFFVRDARGTTSAVRSASLRVDARGYLADERNRRVLDVHGRGIAVAERATIDEHGRVMQDGDVRAHLRLTPGAEVRAGFREAANVDAVGSMVEILGAQRAYETAQKTLAAADAVRAKASAEIARVTS